MFKNFINDESGATAIEYGIIVSTLGAAMAVVAWWWGSFFSWGFTTIADCLSVGFDPECYSASSNQGVPTLGDDPAWWPHEA